MKIELSNDLWIGARTYSRVRTFAVFMFDFVKFYDFQDLADFGDLDDLGDSDDLESAILPNFANMFAVRAFTNHSCMFPDAVWLAAVGLQECWGNEIE